MNYIKEVEKFHKLFNHPIKEEIGIPNEKRCELRVSLIQEELNELQEAINNNDMVEVADALCDIQYVLSGAILEFGLKDKFDELFAEVQRSNMSKACSSMEVAEKTKESYEAKGVECYIKEKDNLYLVYRSADDKILKSIDYSPANLKLD